MSRCITCNIIIIIIIFIAIIIIINIVIVNAGKCSQIRPPILLQFKTEC